MITFENALEIAQKSISRFNYCQETDDAYIFGYDWGELRYGGEGAPCVIFKKDGKIMSMPSYIINGGNLDKIKDIYVEEYIKED